MTARVLVIAGSDSGGGAGIQADIKTLTALGAFATTAITVLTAQNTLGVQGVHAVPSDFVRQQIASVLDDIGTDVVKSGLLPDRATVEVVAACLQGGTWPLVLDPVMVATSGDRLMRDDAVGVLRQSLLPRASILTPNLPEAEALSRRTITDVPSMRDAARALLDLGPSSVLLKGGHLPGETVFDLLATHADVEVFSDPRIAGRNTHGTGCTLASAIAASLAQGMSLRDAVVRARRYVRAAMLQAAGFGSGHGPLNHAVDIA